MRRMACVGWMVEAGCCDPHPVVLVTEGAAVEEEQTCQGSHGCETGAWKMNPDN